MKGNFTSIEFAEFGWPYIMPTVPIDMDDITLMV